MKLVVATTTAVGSTTANNGQQRLKKRVSDRCPVRFQLVSNGYPLQTRSIAVGGILGGWDISGIWDKAVNDTQGNNVSKSYKHEVNPIRGNRQEDARLSFDNYRPRSVY